MDVIKAEEKIAKLQAKVNSFTDEIENEIYSVCESLDYTNSSRFSYNIDRFIHFRKELNEFKIIKK